MRTVSLAGGTVVTTDRVATALVQLTAALARRGLAEAVRIPAFQRGTGHRSDAELVVGVGAPVLSVAADWPTADPETEESAAALRRMLEQLGAPGLAASTPHYDRVLDDPEFHLPAYISGRSDAPVRLRPRESRQP